MSLIGRFPRSVLSKMAKGVTEDRVTSTALKRLKERDDLIVSRQGEAWVGFGSPIILRIVKEDTV